MADVGDKVSVRSKAGPRLGVVRAVSGSMLRILWETGGETSLAPGPGVLTIVGKSRGKRPAKAAVAKKKAARPSTPTPAKRPKSAQRAATKKAASKKTAQPRPAAKAAAKKKPAAPAARKAASRKKASPAKAARKKAR